MNTKGTEDIQRIQAHIKSALVVSSQVNMLARLLVLFGLILVVESMGQLLPWEDEGEKAFAKREDDGKWYQKQISDSGVQMGQIDLDDMPLKGLSDDQALGLLFQRYRARMMHQQEPRHFEMETEDLSEREIADICGNSASLECGKKVLKNVPALPSGDDNKETNITLQGQRTISQRCNLRKEFLDCIDMQRKSCRRQADKEVYPRLPPKSIIRSTQSKIWRALWTSGGCTLIN